MVWQSAGVGNLSNPTITNYTETVHSSTTSTAYTIDLSLGTIHDLELTGNCTFTFPAAAAGKQFTLILTQDSTGSRTATWPAEVIWPGGTAPTITATATTGKDVLAFVCDGTSWYGFIGSQDFS